MSNSLSRQTLEISVAGLITAFAAVVIYGSLQLQTGWGSTGPEAGYFPLRLGILLLVVGLLLTVQAARNPGSEVFATGEQLRRVLSQFVPTVALALAAPFTGFYLAAAVFLCFMARRHGGFAWSKAVGIGVFYGRHCLGLQRRGNEWQANDLTVGMANRCASFGAIIFKD